MYYDAVNQLMNLTGGVVGRYEWGISKTLDT
jgi:hypothetical protein